MLALRPPLLCRAGMSLLTRRVVLGTALLAATVASPLGAQQMRRTSIDAIALGAGRSMDVAATDSGLVIVTVNGGKHPLVAESSAEDARRWVARVNSISRLNPPFGTRRETQASERNEFGHNSDILRYQRITAQRGRRDVIAIDIGPNNLTMYEADVPSSVLGRLAGTMLRAAHAADSLTRLARSTPRRAPVAMIHPASDTGDALTPSKRCMSASGMPPMDYTGPNGYAPGTNLDKILQPPLFKGSPVPAYPQSASGARVVGNVVASFVIDAAGRPVVETFRLRGPANALFVQSVCDALPSMRFVPGVVKGKAVPQLVEKTFTIAPAPPHR